MEFTNLSSSDHIELEPIRMDLVLVNTLTGGYVENILTSVSNYGFIKHLETSDNQKFIFNEEFNLKQKGTTKYLAHGSYTAVFAIDQVPMDNNYTDTEEFEFSRNNQLIIRMVDDNNSSTPNINDFVNDNWRNDKHLYGNNIMDIYMYGKIFNNNDLISSYIITKKYDDFTIIKNYEYEQKKQLFLSMLEFLTVLKHNNTVYRDLKFENIGCNIVEDKHIFLVLDYDHMTLLSLNDPFWEDYKRIGCSWMCTGTYAPYYAIVNFYTKLSIRAYSDDIEKLKPFLMNIHVLGLVEILTKLFLNYDTRTYINNRIVYMMQKNNEYASPFVNNNIPRKRDESPFREWLKRYNIKIKNDIIDPVIDISEFSIPDYEEEFRNVILNTIKIYLNKDMNTVIDHTNRLEGILYSLSPAHVDIINDRLQHIHGEEEEEKKGEVVEEEEKKALLSGPPPGFEEEEEDLSSPFSDLRLPSPDDDLRSPSPFSDDDLDTPPPIPILKRSTTSGYDQFNGGNYLNYLKYKKKYLTLKNKIYGK